MRTKLGSRFPLMLNLTLSLRIIFKETLHYIQHTCGLRKEDYNRYSAWGKHTINPSMDSY